MTVNGTTSMNGHSPLDGYTPPDEAPVVNGHSVVSEESPIACITKFTREPTTGINVIVIGCGIGGLMAAIELYRQGHDVRVIEGKPQIEGLGDFVGICPSATRQFKKWPGMFDAYMRAIYRPALALYKYDGELLGGPFSIKEGIDHIPTPVSRPKLIDMLYQYVCALGITVVFGKPIIEYIEDVEIRVATAITEDGQRFHADLIIAADGVASKSWKIVTGHQNQPKSSGFSVYRVAYPTKCAFQDTLVAKSFALPEDGDDICRVYLGKNTHAIVLVSPETTTWFLTHKASHSNDRGTAAEQWSRNLNGSDVVKEMAKELDWDKSLLAVMNQTPPKTVVDYNILWRNPNLNWTSPGGLILQLGDSAHSFLPTSANGATQAMEDGISIAACLKLARKHNIALATKVHTTLRYQRVACAQRSGFKNREKWHQTDFEEAKKHPEKLVMQVGRWINLHDPEDYVYKNWTKCVNHLIRGTSFEHTNIPLGYTYTPWTIDELLDASRVEQETVDEGDWT